jgi:cleavage stimulation factor subunit 3
MSEHPDMPVFPDNGTADLTNGPGDEPTIPTAEILNVLEQLKASQQSESSQTRTQSQPQSQSQNSQSQDPPSEWTILRTSLSEKPHDPDGWRRLVEIAETGGDVEQIKATYEALLATYPNTVCLDFRL